MERYLFVKTGDGFVKVPVSDVAYNEVMDCLKQAVCCKDENGIPCDIAECRRKNLVSVFVKDRDYFRRVDFARIKWVEASGSYCCMHLEDKRKLMLSYNLSELSAYLPPYFVRVHRSFIVNMNYIDSFIGNMLCVGQERIPVSKQHKKGVIACLNIIGNVK